MKLIKKCHEVGTVRFRRGRLVLEIDGREYQFVLSEISQKLAQASPLERNKFEVSPGGYGIHWPLLDEDLSLDGLLGIRHRPHSFKGV